jgi:hypothetical protein
MVVIMGFVFVLEHLSVEFVGQLVNGGIEIGMNTLGVQVFAFDMDAAFGFLALVFVFGGVYRENDLHIDNLIKMARDTTQLGLYIGFESGGDFKMVATDGQIHNGLLCKRFDDAPKRYGQASLTDERPDFGLPHGY